MQNVMIDIETLGTKPGCVVLSIAAVRFDIKTGQDLDKIKINVDLESCLKIGLKVEADTFKWWMNEDRNIFSDLLKNTVSINHALRRLNNFLRYDDYVWGNSARFDFGILSHVYEIEGFKTPWYHGNERCLRTISSLIPKIKDEEEFVGDKHNALHDCEHQIKYLVKTLKQIENGVL